jgi:hypothetical protein
MTDTIVLLAEFNGINLTFKLLQEDGIQFLHQHSEVFRGPQENPYKRHFPRVTRSVRSILSVSVKGLYGASVAE